tara:strand:+ start:2565 stop:3281 length:717 start_codon:yes stop_codon:yes gene_type:complete
MIPDFDVVIVIPTYNEAANLPALVESLFGLGLRVRIVFVDDGSPDGTADVARHLARQYRFIKVVERSGKQGLGTAYVEGFAHALLHSPTFIVQMDADLSHPPLAIPGMISELCAGADVAVGSRYVEGGGVDASWSFKRRFLSSASNRMIRAVTGVKVRDATGGFKAYRADALAKIDFTRIRSKGFGFQTEVAMACQRLGLNVVEHPITFIDRAQGQSKMSAGIMLEAIWRLGLLRVKG